MKQSWERRVVQHYATLYVAQGGKMCNSLGRAMTIYQFKRLASKRAAM